MSYKQLSRRTTAEKALAAALTKRKISFLHNIYLFGYEIDLFLPAYHMAFEVDGFQHLSAAQQKLDHLKEERLASAGINLFRVTNRQIYQDLPKSLIPIETFLKNLDAYAPSPNSINIAWKEPLRQFRPNPTTSDQPQKFATIEDYFLSLEDK